MRKIHTVFSYSGRVITMYADGTHLCITGPIMLFCFPRRLVDHYNYFYPAYRFSTLLLT